MYVRTGQHASLSKNLPCELAQRTNDGLASMHAATRMVPGQRLLVEAVETPQRARNSGSGVGEVDG